MAKNIYDLFNERKYGVDYLVEGVNGEIEEVEAYESLDEASLALLKITQEATNEAIELQAAWYLEDLVIESMMYDDFNEERIMGVMEGSMKEKAGKAAEYIKQKWQQIKQWFASTFKAIANHFASGETLVKKHKNEIPKALARSEAKIKAPIMLNSPDVANGECAKMVGALKTSRISGENGKEQVLKLVGAEDRKGLGEKVKHLFFGKVVETRIRDYYKDAGMMMAWAGNKKQILDDFKKQQKQVDEDFKEILGKLKNGAKADGAGDAEKEIVKNFNFAINLKNTILSSQLQCNKQMCNLAIKVIRKALGTAPGEDQKLLTDKNPTYSGAEANKKADADVDKERFKDRRTNMALSDDDVEESFKAYLPQFEAFEIFDEEEKEEEKNNNDEWNWE